MSSRARFDLRGFPTRPAEIIRQWDGPLTRDLVRTPGPFGLGQLPERLVPDAVARTVCGYCSIGCSLSAHLHGGEAINLSPDRDYPVNRGMACPKGWEALAALDAPDRATRPLLRGPDGTLRPVGWPQAVEAFVSRFRSVEARHGPGATAFLSTGQIATEEMMALGALGRIGMGMRHADGNTRQCMATAVAAYKESFGFDAPPFAYSDLEESDVLVFVGANPCIAHPILWERVCRNPHRPEIVVVDPRRTETAMAATCHVAVRPKGDLPLLYAVARRLIELGAVDRPFVDAHTEGFEDFARHVAAFTPESVSAATGLPASEIDALAEVIAQGRRVSFWWTMGVNQGHEATRTAQALIDLALMTGNIGRPGTGANSVTGQCNAMGSRLFSNTTCLFGGRDFGSAAQRAEVAEILDVDPATIPSRAGLAYDEILQAILAGEIRGLWVVATNSAHSWIHHQDFAEARAKLDFLVVQDMYTTAETARMADLVLPAAGWGEKDGTFINSERRFGRIRKVRRAPGQALSDLAIFRLLAKGWGFDLLDGWKTAEDVFAVLKRLSEGRPCDVTGIDGYEALDAEGGIQWPHPAGSGPPGRERRLFEDGVFFRPNGRARFCFDDPRPVPEPTDASHPFVLLTGRGSSSQWHTQTRTAKSPVLRKLSREEAYVEIHPEDARRLGITSEEKVCISSRRGSMEAVALVRETVPAGSLFVPMHYAATNRLTHPTVDPHSRQPAYKHCAVRLERLPRRAG